MPFCDETGEIIGDVLPGILPWTSSPLHDAVLHSDAVKVNLTIAKHGKFAVNQMFNNTTPLHLAVKTNNYVIAKRLLEAKAQVNAKTGDEEETPFHLACSSGNTKMAQLLILFGADINMYSNTVHNPLFTAVSNGHTEIVKILVKHKASMEWRNPSGFTAIYMAVFNQRPEIAMVLIEAGCQVNAVDKYGRSLLHYVVENHCNCGLRYVMQYINIDTINNRDYSGIAPLYLACELGDSIMVNQLLSYGADADIMCQQKTPLYIASLKGYTKIVRLLIENGADVCKPCEYKNTALHAAVGSIKIDMDLIKELIKGGCDVEAVNVYQNSPLQVAMLHGNHEAAKLLLLAGANMYRIDCPFTRKIMVAFDMSSIVKEGICKAFKNVHEKVPSLKQMAREELKKMLGHGGGYKKSIKKLDLPSTLKDYLSFCDL